MSPRTAFALPLIVIFSILSLTACNVPEGERAEGGKGDPDGRPSTCSISEHGDNSFIIRCPDGSEAIIENGKPGANADDNNGCTLVESKGNVHTLDCGDSQIVLGDNCKNGYPGDVTISGEFQSDSINSALTIIELFGCTSIQGDLAIQEIYSNEPFTLSPALAKITHIGGSLRLNGVNNMEHFEFPALQSVGRNVEFTNNNDMQKMSFAALEFIGGSLNLGSEPDLSQSFYYGGNESLETLNFPVLAAIGKSFNINSELALDALAGLPKLLEIGENLTIVNNTKLASIKAIDQLTSIGGNVTIISNPAINTCEARKQIEALDGFARATRSDEKLVIDAHNCQD